MSSTTIDVASAAALNAAIDQYDTATSGSYTIEITGSIQLPADLDAVDNASGVSLVIDGGGNTLDGADRYRGFVVTSGNVAMQNLTIENAVALGAAAVAGCSSAAWRR